MGICPAITFSVLAQSSPRGRRLPIHGSVPAKSIVANGSDTNEHLAAESEPRPVSAFRAEAMQPCLLMGWTIGVLLLDLKLFFGLIGLRRMLRGRHAVPVEWARRAAVLGTRLGLGTGTTLALSERLSEAVAIGFIRPTVLLPTAWLLEMTPEILEAVIAHELAHLRRGDLWVNLLQRVIESLLFYHPAVWWLSSRIRRERELCCDALAVAVTGQQVDYLRALQWVGQKRTSPTSPRLEVAMGGSNMALTNRVRCLIGLKPVRERVQWWPAWAAILVTLAGLWSATCFSIGNPSQIQAAEQGKSLQPGYAVHPYPYCPTPADVRTVGPEIRPDSDGVVHEAPFAWLEWNARSNQPPKPVPAAKASITVPAGKNLYKIRSAIIMTQRDGEPKTLLCPTIAVVEGVMAIFSDASQTPIVTAIKGAGDAKKPTIHVLDEGITGNVTAYGNDDGRITVDARVELSRIGRVNVKNGRQTTQVKTQRMRTIDCVRPGEKVVATFDPVEGDSRRYSVEFVVTEIKPSEQATNKGS